MTKELNAWIMMIVAMLAVAGIPIGIIARNRQICIVAAMTLVCWYFIARGLVFLYGEDFNA